MELGLTVLSARLDSIEESQGFLGCSAAWYVCANALTKCLLFTGNLLFLQMDSDATWTK